jgi:hypothetical protein
MLLGAVESLGAFVVGILDAIFEVSELLCDPNSVRKSTILE